MIRFEKIVKRFRRNQVLKGVNLTIERGQRVALVGSNGAGKTTLIRCLLGEYTCTGKLRVDGMEPRRQRREVLAKVGFVPQLPPPLRMPVAPLIRYSASLCACDPKRIRKVAGRLGFDIEQFRRQPFYKLSGGQKQKLLIAIALGRETELLVMDEPAANLDPEARHIFFQLLAEKQQHAVMLISSHRLDEVASLVNRVIELDQGQVVLDDRVADLVALSSRLHCQVKLIQPEAAFARAIGEWGFVGSEQDLVWTGHVAGPDRLRFLGVLSRYAALLAGIRMDEVPQQEVMVDVG
jgi:ABC-2 type transport system ATP-binding protein